MGVEKNLSRYIAERGIKIAALSRKTGIPYEKLWGSLGKGNRRLMAGEMIKVCKFLKVDPMGFAGEGEDDF